MNKFQHFYALFVQKGSNLLERLIMPILYQKKGDLTVEQNIRYSDNKHSLCDYYYLPTKEKKPIMIYIHGGGFISGIKDLRKYYCYEYARKGYFVMNTNYDYAPTKKHPFQLHQLFKAIENLLDNATKYNLDTSKIVIAGESAGAFFATYISAITKYRNLYDELDIHFKYRDTFDIKASVLLNGACDEQILAKIRFPNMGTFLRSYYGISAKEFTKEENKEKCHYFSAVKFINSSFPPTVVIEGAHDPLCVESQNLIKIFNEKKIKHLGLLASGIVSPHGFCLATKTKEGKRILDLTQNFVEEVLKA